MSYQELKYGTILDQNNFKDKGSVKNKSTNARSFQSLKKRKGICSVVNHFSTFCNRVFFFFALLNGNNKLN